MPRNLNEIVRSWIRLQYSFHITAPPADTDTSVESTQCQTYFLTTVTLLWNFFPPKPKVATESTEETSVRGENFEFFILWVRTVFVQHLHVHNYVWAKYPPPPLRTNDVGEEGETRWGNIYWWQCCDTELPCWASYQPARRALLWFAVVCTEKEGH